jgi:hypothetical protein
MFRRAIECGSHLVALTTAGDLGQLSLDEALELLRLIAKREPNASTASPHAGTPASAVVPRRRPVRGDRRRMRPVGAATLRRPHFMGWTKWAPRAHFL